MKSWPPTSPTTSGSRPTTCSPASRSTAISGPTCCRCRSNFQACNFPCPMDKVERLTNIVALLLTTSRPLTLDEIADEVGGYPERGESRRAAFERDKKTLRAEGVPLEVVPQS